jgi:hypothetical protein
MKTKRRPVRNARVATRSLPLSLYELGRSGGPNAMIRQAELEAGDQEARFWLEVLESQLPQIPIEDGDDIMLSAIVHGWIKSLRQRLGLRPSPDVIRAQTRERVRRYRERQAAPPGEGA